MTKEDFLKHIEQHLGNNPIHRNFMSSVEIKIANQLVKEGLLEKGHDNKGLVIYYLIQNPGKTLLEILL